MAVGFLLNNGHLEPSMLLLYVCLPILLRNYISEEEGRRGIEYKPLNAFVCEQRLLYLNPKCWAKPPHSPGGRLS